MKKTLLIIVFVLTIISFFNTNTIKALNNLDGPIISISEPDNETDMKIQEGKIKFKSTTIGILLKNELDLNKAFEDEQLENISYDEYLTIRTKYTRDYYNELRTTFIEKYDKFSKKYDLRSDLSSPYFFIYTSKQIKSINDLVNISSDFKDMIYDDLIESIFEITFYEHTLLGPPPESVFDPGGASDPSAEYNEDIFELINVMDLIETYHDGSGIKIGFFEFDGVIDQYDEAFVGRDVYIKDNEIDTENSPVDTLHATNVARIAAGNEGIARDSYIYSAEYEYDEEGNIRMPDNEIDWFAINGVNIINASFGIDYSPVEKSDAYWYMNYFEQIMTDNNIIIVAAAGNLDYIGESIDTIMYPAMSPSVIAVGGTNETGDDIYDKAEYTSAVNFDYIQKPNIVAPAYVYGYKYYSSTGVTLDNQLIDGTSYSAPMITGAIALLLEQNPDLKGSTLETNTIGAVHALLAASTNQEVFDSNTYFTNDGGYDNMLGAGLLDVEKLLEIGGTSWSNANLVKAFRNDIDYNIILSKSIGFVPHYSNVTISLWWNAKNYNAYLSDNNLRAIDWSDYSITSGNGYQTESVDSNNNFELLKYKTTVGANITINVYQEEYFFQDNQGAYFGDIIWLSWRID